MKICVAQTKPIKGDVQSNISRHEVLIKLAVSNGADVIIFPELSLTGYEPTIAKEMAIGLDDSRLKIFQTISDSHEIIIGVGAPTRNDAGVCISVLLFRPQQPRKLYSKMFLHSDETAFFVSGERDAGLIGANNDIALAICCELSVVEHATTAFNNGARTYIASVAKTASGVAKGTERLATIAREHTMTVLMANSVGLQDGFHSAGKSAVWNRKGQLRAQMDDDSEGIVVFDTITEQTTVVYMR